MCILGLQHIKCRRCPSGVVRLSARLHATREPHSTRGAGRRAYAHSTYNAHIQTWHKHTLRAAQGVRRGRVHDTSRTCPGHVPLRTAQVGVFVGEAQQQPPPDAAGEGEAAAVGGAGAAEAPPSAQATKYCDRRTKYCDRGEDEFSRMVEEMARRRKAVPVPPSPEAAPPETAPARPGSAPSPSGQGPSGRGPSGRDPSDEQARARHRGRRSLGPLLEPARSLLVGSRARHRGGSLQPQHPPPRGARRGQ